MPKIRSTISAFAALAALSLSTPLVAQHHDAHHASRDDKTDASGKLVKVKEVDAAWLAEARKSYPLEVCVTSDEKLDGMGDASEFVYRAKGQPDRLVKFCCDGCEEDFLKEPAKYLSRLDEAAKAKSSEKKPAADAKGHRGHHE